jgi:predicted ester cyclase
MPNHKKSFAILFTLAVLGAMSLGCAPDGEEEKNTAAMKRIYDELNKGNLKAIDELVADNFRAHHIVPDTRMSTDKAAMSRELAEILTVFPDLQLTILDLVAKGDKVWAYTVMRGTHKGAFLGRKPTGKKFEAKGVEIVRLVNGKAVEKWSVFDALAMLQQLELLCDSNPISSLTIQPTMVELFVTEKTTLTLNAETNYVDFDVPFERTKWSSTKPAVAKVDKKGRVTGISPGYAAITASLEDVSAHAIVLVKPLPQ